MRAMNDPEMVGRSAFVRGLITFAWLSIALLGPVALFFTWYGDCFAEACPTVTSADRLVYDFDAVAWIAIAIIGLAGARRPHRGAFVALALLGLAFAAQGAAGFLGVPGFYAFGLLLPASAFLILGGVLGSTGTSARSRWAGRSETSAFELGCATYFVSFFALFGLASAASGQIVGLLLAVLLFALVGVVFVLSGHVRRPGKTPRVG
jgi:hypothetical protein